MTELKGFDFMKNPPKVSTEIVDKVVEKIPMTLENQGSGGVA